MLRIISGEFRRRLLNVPPDAETTRPYPDRVKESVFGLLRGHCEGATVFDGFSGPGTMGLEAVSRGAKMCVFVERERSVIELLHQNIEMLGCADRCEVFAGDALGAGALARAPRPLTIAFLDPPYAMVREPMGFKRVMAQLQNLVDLLTPDGFAVFRTPWPLQHAVWPEGVTPPPVVEEGRRAPSRKDKRGMIKRARRVSRDEDKGIIRPFDAARVRGVGDEVPSDSLADELGTADDFEAQLEAAEKALEEAGVVVPKPTVVDADLTLPRALGPETHVYHTMAVHLYARKPQ
jgi:16S rRNA (guanine966-N2)-methyltransferase